jgi:small-conductance mechanosensitive channel
MREGQNTGALITRLIAGLLAIFIAAAGLAAGARAQTAEPAAPPQVRELLRLLGEPGVRSWLEEELKKSPKPEPQAATHTLMTRLVRGALSAIVILLLADLLWQVLKTLIDRRLAAAQGATALEGEEAAREARLRTLLPIFRNIALVALAVVAVMMALSALGVEIGPLIAGAGVAVGFGAQTLVRDVISGVFYLFDDAFRVGEYIQSGSYKGTVESFSLRSVKLRHHRGRSTPCPSGSSARCRT